MGQLCFALCFVLRSGFAEPGLRSVRPSQPKRLLRRSRRLCRAGHGFFNELRESFQSVDSGQRHCKERQSDDGMKNVTRLRTGTPLVEVYRRRHQDAVKKGAHAVKKSSMPAGASQHTRTCRDPIGAGRPENWSGGQVRQQLRRTGHSSPLKKQILRFAQNDCAPISVMLSLGEASRCLLNHGQRLFQQAAIPFPGASPSIT